MVSWLRTDPCFSLADGQILALRVRVSVRVASARVGKDASRDWSE